LTAAPALATSISTLFEREQVPRWPSPREKPRSHDSLKATGYQECPNCGELRLPHNLCPSCGHYKGREILKTEA
jgi:large subunit ribosomal protein L32